MATRFRLPASGAAAVSPAVQTTDTNLHTQPTNLRIAMPTTDASALANASYVPDGADHLVQASSVYRQYVSDPMAAGNVFTAGDVLKCAVQQREANAGNNLFFQILAFICSEDGTTIRATIRSKVSDANEVATTIVNKFLTTTLSASYTTVAGDRLCVEFSQQGTCTAAGGVQGHNGEMRWGSNGAGGDLPENDTEAGTTLNPWIEFATTITWPAADIELVVADMLIALAAESPALVQANTLALADALIALAAESPALTQANTLALQDAAIALATESPTLAPDAIPLVVADAAVPLAVDAPALTQANTLVANDALAGLAAESPALTQANVLAAADVTVALGAEAPALTQANVLAAQDATAALAAESPTLELAGQLSPADSLVGLAADNATLVQQNTLAAQDATVATSAESPTVSFEAMLDLAEVRIALGIESPILVQQNLLAPDDSLIGLDIGTANFDLGAFVMQVSGHPVMSASVTGSRATTARLTGGRVFTGGIS